MKIKYPNRQKQCPDKKGCIGYAGRECDICAIGRKIECYERRLKQNKIELQFLRGYITRKRYARAEKPTPPE